MTFIDLLRRLVRQYDAGIMTEAEVKAAVLRTNLGYRK